MAVVRKPTTPWGMAKLKAELKHLREVLKPENVRAIEEARAHGDLSENAEYKYAKEQQGFIAGREQMLESNIATAEVIDISKLSGERVVFGATVELLDVDTDEELCYTLVGECETNADKGRISIVSPIARALVGKRVGDEATVRAPKGSRHFEILDVTFNGWEDWE